MIKKDDYSPFNSIEQKSFRSSLFHFVKNEYGFTMGNLAIKRFCEDVESLVEKFYPKSDRIKPGQMLWLAVSEDEKPSYAKRIENTKMVPVILTILSDSDINDFKECKKLKEIKLNVIKRITNEAKEQKGVLSEIDIKCIMKICTTSISKMILGHEKITGEIIPRRGTVHDIGRSISHKNIICYKYFVKKNSIIRISKETNHSLEEVERYLFDCKRVKYCKLKGMNVDQISYVLKMSKNLVKEYLELIENINYNDLNDDLEEDLLEVKLNPKPLD